jgi:hypothetical protein
MAQPQSVLVLPTAEFATISPQSGCYLGGRLKGEEQYVCMRTECGQGISEHENTVCREKKNRSLCPLFAVRSRCSLQEDSVVWRVVVNNDRIWF